MTTADQARAMVMALPGVEEKNHADVADFRVRNRIFATLPDDGRMVLRLDPAETSEIQEGIALITRTLPRSLIGPYQLQAAIAAVHAEAVRAEDTDWPQILALYELLERIAPSPVVTLNHAVALAMVKGPDAGLAMLADLDTDGRLAGHHRVSAVRAHLLDMAGDHAAARACYRTAASLTMSLPEQRYLEARAARLADGSHAIGAAPELR